MQVGRRMEDEQKSGVNGIMAKKIGFVNRKLLKPMKLISTVAKWKL